MNQSLDMNESEEHGHPVAQGGEFEKYGTVAAWTRELQLSDFTISDRLEGVEGTEGRDKRGMIRVFYAESVVRAVCADLLLSGIYQADKNGFFVIQQLGNPVRYGTPFAWSKELAITSSTIDEYLTDKPCLLGKDASGRSRKFYEESIVRQVCERFTSAPHADADGFYIERNGEEICRYASVRTWARVLNISLKGLAGRLQNVEGKTVINASGRLVKNGFYSEPIIRSAYANLVSSIPSADKNGIVLVNGEQYATLKNLSQILNISFPALKKRLQSDQEVLGKDSGGRMGAFYSKKRAGEVCADLLNCPKGNADGFLFLEKNGEVKRYAGIETWAKYMSVSKSTLVRRLQAISFMWARDKSGRRAKFYLEDDVRSVDNI